MRIATKGLRLGVAIATGAMLLSVGAISATAALSTPAMRAHPNYGQLPPVKGTRPLYNHGTLTVGQIAGVTPNYILPVTPAANLSVYTAQFYGQMWRPLVWAPSGDSVPSVAWQEGPANPPRFSDRNRVVTWSLKNWNWSNGKPVTANDVLFDYWLFKAAITISPANEGNYTPGLFPDNVASIRALNEKTLRIVFTKTYNQDFLLYTQLGLLYALPAAEWAKASATGPILGANTGANGFENLTNAKAIYGFLSGQAGTESTYASNPLWQTVDGPFRLTSFTPATGAFTMARNNRYGGHKAYIKKLEFETFTSTQAEFDQLLANNLDIAGVDFSNLPEVGQIKNNYYVWGEPNFGWEYVVYNFKDHTGHFANIINQLYIRQALAHLQDEQAEIQSRGRYDGAAYPAYGPVPSVPVSPLAPPGATHNPYPFSIKAAAKLLKDHGWAVRPGGTTRCEKPGTGAHDCGAGIPRGTPLTWPLVYGNTPAIFAGESADWAANAKRVGITMKLSSKTFNFQISNYNDVSAPKNDNSWAMDDFGGFTGIIYPTTNEVFNTSGSFNLGGFHGARVDQAIHNSIYSLSNEAVKKEAELITLTMPGLFQANPDLIYAISKKISAQPQYFTNLSQFTNTPEWWYFKK